MLTITKEFHFSASHVLDRLPSWHPCARMHGHNYIVVLELSARREDLTEAGFVRDYRELDAFKKWMDDTLDHRHLNEAMGGGYLSVGRESGHMDLRPLDRALSGVEGGQGFRDAQDMGRVPTGAMNSGARWGAPHGRRSSRPASSARPGGVRCPRRCR